MVYPEHGGSLDGVFEVTLSSKHGSRTSESCGDGVLWHLVHMGIL